MVTRQEALAAIEAARVAMADAVRKAHEARDLSTQAGILTAADIIAEGVGEARAEAIALLPQVSGDTVATTAADVQAVHDARDQVIEAATNAGRILAMAVKAAVAIAAKI